MTHVIASTHLAPIDGMAATITPGFVREQWTTCHIGSLDRGDICSLPAEVPRPVVITAIVTEPVPGSAYGRTTGKATDLATGEIASFELLANRSVLTRCDIRYAEHIGPD